MVLQHLGSVLHHCSKTKSFQYGSSLHALALKMGSLADVFISNHVLNMYAKCGYMDKAKNMFDEMSDRNLVSWSAIISGYQQRGQPLLALSVFSEIPMQPNEYIYASVLSACASLLDLNQGRQVHAHSITSGFAPISFVSNSLISMYMNCHIYSDAAYVFNTLSERNSVSFNAMIMGFAENGQLGKCMELFQLMNSGGILPDRFSFVAVLGICANTENIERGKELHCQTVKLGLDITSFVGNVIITMYSKCNLIQDAMKAFESVTVKDAISWNTMISACSHCEDHSSALEFFRDMGKDGDLRPDNFTYASVLTACSGLASIRFGGQIHGHLIRMCVYLDIGVNNALVNMYAKCGCIRNATLIFHLMTEKNLVSWNTMIIGLANHGYGQMAIDTFERMKMTLVRPDSVTFIGLLVACNHSGLVDLGQAYFNSMEEVYGITAQIEHFSCLIDLLGRGGRLDEAEEYLKSSPWNRVRDDPVVWGSLLSACRLYGDERIGERAADILMENGPKTSSPYVLLSNLYASNGRWEGVAEMRKMLKGSGVKKEPGYSIIEVNGVAMKFTVGESPHFMKDIMEIFRSLTWFVKETYLEA